MASSDVAGRVRNARGEGQVLRQQFVDAAARLLATAEQPELLTLRQVAREVGASPASIYSHFPDLAALFEHVLEGRYRELAELMAVADRAPTPLGRLVQRCATYVRWGVQHPGEYRTLFGGRAPSGVSVAAHRGGSELLDATTDALAAVTDPEHDASAGERRRAGILLWTSMHGTISALAEHPNMEWPSVDDLITSIVGLHAAVPRSEISILLDVHLR